MIRHNNVFINGYRGIFQWNLVDEIFCKLTQGHRDGKPVPYDSTECFLSTMGADRNEICTILAVVIFCKSVWFSLVVFHDGLSVIY